MPFSEEVAEEIRALLDSAAQKALSTYYNDTAHEDKFTALGVAVAQYCEWEKTALKKVLLNALEDANFHELYAELEAIFEGAKLETRELCIARKQAVSNLDRLQAKLSILQEYALRIKHDLEA